VQRRQVDHGGLVKDDQRIGGQLRQTTQLRLQLGPLLLIKFTGELLLDRFAPSSSRKVRKMVFAIRLVDLANRRAALPARAANNNLPPERSHRSQIVRVTKVLPVPAPPRRHEKPA
jgi:hypothetical protein